MIRTLSPRHRSRPGGQRQLVAVVARQVDGDQAGVGARQIAHDRPAAVGRPVIDEHQLVIARRPHLARLGQALVERGDAGFLLVVARNDDRQRGHCGIRLSALSIR